MATIGIIGSGTMGSGIAEVAAISKHTVMLQDVSKSALATGLDRIKKSLNRSVEKDRLTAPEATEILARISTVTAIESLSSCDLVIEAALEDLSVKRGIFKALDDLLKPEAILATNTSSLSITSIASAVKRSELVVGMHFFNPPVVMKLVEVVAGKETAKETLVATVEIARSMGKTPVLCKDTPGFIVNRVARPFYGEALRLLGEGIAPVEDIDKIVKSGGFRMGPFELMDLIGIDINFAVTQSVYEQFFNEPRFRPHPIQRQMVEAGTLGRKTGRGFYTYDQKKPQ